MDRPTTRKEVAARISTMSEAWTPLPLRAVENMAENLSEALV
jgi:hypothetical protein